VARRQGRPPLATTVAQQGRLEVRGRDASSGTSGGERSTFTPSGSTPITTANPTFTSQRIRNGVLYINQGDGTFRPCSSRMALAISEPWGRPPATSTTTATSTCIAATCTPRRQPGHQQRSPGHLSRQRDGQDPDLREGERRAPQRGGLRLTRRGKSGKWRTRDGPMGRPWWTWITTAGSTSTPPAAYSSRSRTEPDG